MNRTEAIGAEHRALDEIAVLNRRIDTLNLLIVYHATHPVLVQLLDEMRHDYQARLRIAQQRRRRIAENL